MYLEAHAIFKAIDQVQPAGECIAKAAQCELQLGHGEAALLKVNEALVALSGELAKIRPVFTIDMRWDCQQVLEVMSDARASGVLDQLHDDVQADLATAKEPADRDRMLQGLPGHRAILDAHRRNKP